ncbi:MAG: hypothetical protein U0Q22_13580 [Acidimicrobiales bacterium]
MPLIAGPLFVVVFVLGVLAVRAQRNGPPDGSGVAAPVDRVEALRLVLHMLAMLAGVTGVVIGFVVMTAPLEGAFHVDAGATVFAYLIWLATAVTVALLVGVAFVAGQIDRLSRAR